MKGSVLVYIRVEVVEVKINIDGTLSVKTP